MASTTTSFNIKSFSGILRRQRMLSGKAVTALSALMVPAAIYSMPIEHYASESVLASGKWAKINVTSTGMQLISNAQLRNLGFTEPEKVRVFGYGGEILPELLNETNPDDLPEVPSIRTAKGIVFFGTDAVRWSRASSGLMDYTHTSNPYSDQSCYFISDIEGNSLEIPVIEAPASSTEKLTTFNCRLLHEQDLEAPGNTGRMLLGEDFRVQSTRTFSFSLPDNAGSDARISTRFGARVSGTSASLLFTANGNQLKATSSDVISAVSKSTYFLNTTTTQKLVENAGDNLSLSIKFSTSGTLFTARLDHIEVEYERELKLRDGELYFYGDVSGNSDFVISGCSDETVIWDITDPLNTKTVKYTLSGNSASFNVAEAGYREFIAFDPSKIQNAVTSPVKVSNQNIHAMEAPGMLLISPREYIEAANRIAQIHASTDGLTVAVLTPEEIYNEFSSGSPDVTAFRRLLKMWYDRGASTGDYTRYCLILSRPTYDNKLVSAAVKNAGYPRIPIWQSDDKANSDFDQDRSFSTDDYIGMLDDNRTSLSMSSAKIHVAVGRMPVKSVQEAASAVAKLEKYVMHPSLGSWRNNIMLIADDQNNAIHLKQSQDVYNNLTSTGIGKDFIYEKLYLDSYPLEFSGTGPEYPQAKERMFQKFNEGVFYVDYIGHANPKSWTHENLLNWTDITSMSNSKLPFLYAATCEFMRWDDDAVSGAEEMWLNPNAGFIGMICPSRAVFIDSNGTLNKNTAKEIFKRGEDGLSKRIGDFYIEGKNSLSTSNKLRYGLMGDPAMRFTNINYSVAVDSINGISLAEAGDNLPEISARSRVSVSGHITDLDGNPVDDFNGIAEITMYDAEKPITTYGNGSEGQVQTYNDRKTRLYMGRANVIGGKWNLDILMPSEIENNYSPALLNVYASDSISREAAGSTTDFYVYGYDSSMPEDTEGPEITRFVLNSDSFTNGAVVSPGPLVLAEFNDPSGINLSGAGLGHKMALSLDGKRYLDNLESYYEPDASDVTSGHIAYPLSDLDAGSHTLDLIVWDNANNSSTARIEFSIDVAAAPGIADISTDVNPARTSVVFNVTTDRALEALECVIEVFDLSGALVWSNSSSNTTGTDASIKFGWDLKDKSGKRVNRGIYLYRATVTSSNGASSSKTRKLAVTAP